jgi:hypothetical protein
MSAFKSNELRFEGFLSIKAQYLKIQQDVLSYYMSISNLFIIYAFMVGICIHRHKKIMTVSCHNFLMVRRNLNSSDLDLEFWN